MSLSAQQLCGGYGGTPIIQHIDLEIQTRRVVEFAGAQRFRQIDVTAIDESYSLPIYWINFVGR